MRDRESRSTDRPVFVLGMARSGTTLIGTMVGAHPELTIAPETHFLDLCVQASGFESILTPEDRETVWRRYAEEERFRVLGLDPEKLLVHMQAEQIRDFAGMYRVLLQAYAEHLGSKGWGDKSHLDHVFVEWLLDAYAEARVVCVIRDPRATVASLLSAPWSSGKAFYYALQWRDTMDIVEQIEKRERVLVVQYEDAVRGPEETLSRICSFLEVQNSPAMMRRGDDPAPVDQSAEWQLGEWWATHKAKAMGPVTTDSLERWKDELSEYQIAVTEHICDSAMQKWGYRRRTETLESAHAMRLFGERGMRVLRGALRMGRGKRPRSIFSPRA